MLDFFVCRSAQDKAAAEIIQRRLERGAEARVWIEECEPSDSRSVAEVWDGGTLSAGTILLLSPGSVPLRSGRETWGGLLDHRESGTGPPVACVLLAECKYPVLLKRRDFFDWTDSALEALRALERWALECHAAGSTFQPAAIDWFTGRQREMETLWTSLVDRSGKAVIAGEPRSGKTSLAQQFAHDAAGHFRDILWLACSGRSPASVYGELAQRLGTGQGEDLEEVCTRALEGHRLLLILDQPECDLSPLARVSGSSVLVTARCPISGWLSDLERVDFDRIPVPAQLPPHPEDLHLWRAMSVCRAEMFPLELAARIAGLDLDAARQSCTRLAAARLVVPLDGHTWFRRCSAAFAAGEYQRRHADALVDVYWPSEYDGAFAWAASADWPRALRIAFSVSERLNSEERRHEAVDILRELHRAAQDRSDGVTIAEVAYRLSWLVDDVGMVRRPPMNAEQLSLF